MKIEAIYKFLYASLTLLLLFIIIGFGVTWWKSYRESLFFKKNQDKLDQNIQQAKKKLEIQENYFTKLQKDPEFLQWVARQRIGYVYPNEIIFRFNDGGFITNVSSNNSK